MTQPRLSGARLILGCFLASLALAAVGFADSWLEDPTLSINEMNTIHGCADNRCVGSISCNGTTCMLDQGTGQCRKCTVKGMYATYNDCITTTLTRSCGATYPNPAVYCGVVEDGTP